VRYDDGCMKATYRLTIDGGQLRFGHQLGQGSACGAPTPEMSRAEGIVSGPVTWSVVADTLLVTAKGVGSLAFQRAATTPNTALIETSWRLVTVVDSSRTHLASPGPVSLTIDPDRHLVTTDGCNTLSGQVQLGAHTIDLGQLATTEIACLDPGFSPATKTIDRILTGAVSYRIAGRRLTITNANGGTLTYVTGPASADDLSALINRRWALASTEVTTNQGNTSSGSGSSAVGQTVLEFDGTGGFTLQHRCYSRHGTAAITGDSLDLSDITNSAGPGCPSKPATAAERTEDTFVDGVLGGKATWSVADGQLTVTRADGHAAVFGAA
jgi:heat shock protein HslJ